jgi:hypothetical protein
VSSDAEADWAIAAAWAGQIGPRRIVLRRDRQLFPLSTIERDLSRAALLLAESARGRPAADVAIDGLAALHAYQIAMAEPEDGRGAATLSWRNWRNQVDDMHKSQQIVAFLARGAALRAPTRA